MSNRAAKLLSSLSADELAYFIACTDIFHDEPYACRGRPSMARDRCVTVCYNLEQTLTLSNFPTLNQANNWDCHICSFPFVTNEQFVAVADNGQFLTAATTPTSIGFGGVSTQATQTGTTFLPSSVGPGLSVPPNSGNLTLTPSLFPGSISSSQSERLRYEILAIGVEVVNTTAELYKGGSLIRYRAPCQAQLTQFQASPSAGAYSNITVKGLILPPYNPALAMLYPDSVLDSASKGNYAQHTRQVLGEARALSGQQGLYLYNNAVDLVNGSGWLTINYGFGNTAGATLKSNTLIGDFDLLGSYFTGLTPQSSLSIRYRVVMSFVPPSNDSTLASLATLNPPYNPKIDELIALVQMELPPGVPVGLNAKGDWWKTILGVTAKVAPLVGAAFGAPGMALGSTVGLLANQILETQSGSPPSHPKNTASQNMSNPMVAGPYQAAPVPQQVVYEYAPRPQRAVSSTNLYRPPVPMRSSLVTRSSNRSNRRRSRSRNRRNRLRASFSNSLSSSRA